MPTYIIKIDKRLIVSFFTLLFISSGCGREMVFKETRIFMDTFVEISVVHSDREKALESMDAAFDEIGRLEAEFNRYDDKSELSRLNKYGYKEKTKVSKDLYKIIKDSLYYSESTDESFDITVAKGRAGKFRDILLDEDNRTVSFSSPDVNIDLGGIAKGFAADRAKEVLFSYGINSALINIGGNIYAMGSPPGKERWVIGIRDPLAKSRIVKKIRLKDAAVATSALYERGHHIIDPSTGIPVEGKGSVTVVAPSAEEADALSTAFFVMGKDKAEKFIRSMKKNDDIEVYFY